jgi:hypothetical protein
MEAEGFADGVADRLALSRRLLRTVFVFSVVCLAAPVSCSIFGSVDDSGAKIAGALLSSNLSVVPSGRPPRAPESASAAVCLDFSPFFPFEAAGTEILLLDPAGVAREYVP